MTRVMEEKHAPSSSKKVYYFSSCPILPVLHSGTATVILTQEWAFLRKVQYICILNFMCMCVCIYTHTHVYRNSMAKNNNLIHWRVIFQQVYAKSLTLTWNLSQHERLYLEVKCPVYFIFGGSASKGIILLNKHNLFSALNLWNSKGNVSSQPCFQSPNDISFQPGAMLKIVTVTLHYLPIAIRGRRTMTCTSETNFRGD